MKPTLMQYFASVNRTSTPQFLGWKPMLSMRLTVQDQAAEQRSLFHVERGPVDATACEHTGRTEMQGNLLTRTTDTVCSACGGVL